MIFSSENAGHSRRISLLLLAALSLFALLFFNSALAAEMEAESINQVEMLMGLFGGLALFLFGMEMMGGGLKAAAGERMKEILAKLTSNRVSAAATGAAVTAVIQSSSVTTVLVVGFVSAGLMNLTQSVGIIMGANIGTTVTAQIVAFNVEEAALLFIAIGFGMNFLGKRDSIKHYGAILMGLGLVFYGMGVMSDAMTPLRTFEPFINLMASMDNPFLAILVAALFTALVQSSSATTGIIIVMASQGLITLPVGIALAFGANVGTCITAMLASFGKPPEAVRAAVVHVLFNVLGVLLWIGFIDQLAYLSVWMSPISAELSIAERLAVDTPRQIANANTLFNVVNTLVFLGFAGVFARIATRLVPDKAPDERVLIRPKFLDDELIAVPALALERVRFEIGHQGEIVQEMLARTPAAFESNSFENWESLARMDDQVDLLESEIVTYLGKVRKLNLSDIESQNFVTLMHATDNLRSIGDVIETELAALGKRKIDAGLEVSETMKEMLKEGHNLISKSLALAVQSVRDNDEAAAQQVVSLKNEVDRQVQSSLEHQAKALAKDRPEQLALFRLEMELNDKLKRIYTLSKRIARSVLPRELAARVD